MEMWTKMTGIGALADWMDKIGTPLITPAQRDRHHCHTRRKTEHYLFICAFASVFSLTTTEPTYCSSFLILVDQPQEKVNG